MHFVSVSWKFIFCRRSLDNVGSEYLVTLPPPPSDGAAQGEGPSPPVPLVIEALGNAPVAPTGLPPPLPQCTF